MESLQYTLWYFTGEKREKEHFKVYLGIPLDEVLRNLVPGHAAEARDVYVEHNLAKHDEMVKPFPGTLETLEELRRRGVKLAVVTSKRRRSATFGMEATELLGFFHGTVFYEDTARHKPDPDPILKALDLLGVRQGTVLMVGDSIYDIRAAKNAGALVKEVDVKSAGAGYGPTGRDVLSRENPDYILDSVGQVLSILERCDR